MPRVTAADIDPIILDVARTRRAFLRQELLAVAGDRVWLSGNLEARYPVVPHRLYDRLGVLVRHGEIRGDTVPTRGGSTVTTYALAGAPDEQTSKAAARKRLLYARYRGWAAGSQRQGAGVVGPASELVFHSAVAQVAAFVGYRFLHASGHQVDAVDDVPVPRGPLDNGLVLHSAEDGVPYYLLVEVKSYRNWLYPQSATPGANLKVTIEIEATNASGFDEGKVRTVSENARTLKFEQSGFEES